MKRFLAELHSYTLHDSPAPGTRNLKPDRCCIGSGLPLITSHQTPF